MTSLSSFGTVRPRTIFQFLQSKGQKCNKLPIRMCCRLNQGGIRHSEGLMTGPRERRLVRHISAWQIHAVIITGTEDASICLSRGEKARLSANKLPQEQNIYARLLVCRYIAFLSFLWDNFKSILKKPAASHRGFPSHGGRDLESILT